MTMNADLQTALRQANALACQGNFTSAELQYRRARTLAPNDLQAALGHGHVLRILGRPGDARAVFAAAIAIKPDLADAHHGLAMACQEMSDLDAAESAYRTTLRLRPGTLEALVGLADVLNQQSRPDDALALLGTAGSAAPDAAAALEQTRGTARLLKENHDAALVHFERALILVPGHPKASHSRAVALEHLRRDEEALAAYRKVVAENPANLRAHHGLNQLLFRLKHDGEFLRSYDEAARRMPGVPYFAMAKAEFQVKDGRIESAVALYDEVLATAPDHPVALHGKASALLKLGRAETAIDIYEHLRKLAPDDVSILTGLATAYLVTRDGAKAEAAASQALLRDPTDQVGLAALGIAWRLQDSEREYALNRYDEFIQVIDLEPPEGYADMESFNRDLNAWLDTRHSDAREPIDQSLRGGTQTLGNIFKADHALVRALHARLRESVTRFIANLPHERHPFLARRGGNFAFSGAWSSRLCDHGFHANHLHPGGWISSSYYVSLPGTETNTEKKEGWIKFGEPSYDLGFAQPVRRVIQPQPGRLVLFPSYMWHGTVPFHAPKTRTTIAFDVAPIAPATLGAAFGHTGFSGWQV
jgi:tetratricopeptide (TPR) repeat protein